MAFSEISAKSATCSLISFICLSRALKISAKPDTFSGIEAVAFWICFIESLVDFAALVNSSNVRLSKSMSFLLFSCQSRSLPTASLSRLKFSPNCSVRFLLKSAIACFRASINAVVFASATVLAKSLRSCRISLS